MSITIQIDAKKDMIANRYIDVEEGIKQMSHTISSLQFMTKTSKSTCTDLLVDMHVMFVYITDV